jgi:hypothetical protein
MMASPGIIRNEIRLNIVGVGGPWTVKSADGDGYGRQGEPS